MNDHNTNIKSRKEILQPCLITIIISSILYIGIKSLEPMFINNALYPSTDSLIEGYASKNILSMLEYVFFDISQSTYIFGSLPAIAMVVLCIVATHLENTNSRFRGTGVGGNGKIYIPMLVCSIVATVASQLIYGDIFAQFGFVPTLSSFLFVSHMINFYGVSKEKLIAIFVVITLTSTPICLVLRILVVDTLNLPIFICITLGAVFGIPLAHMIFNFMPFMTPREPDEPVPALEQSRTEWFFNQLFGDFGQMSVNGSSIASAGVVLFSLISFCLNPSSVGLGVGLLPVALFAIFVAGAISIFLYYPQFDSGAPILTFCSMLSVGAIVVTYPENPIIVILSIIYAAIVSVPTVLWVFKVFDYKGEYCVFHLVTLALSIVVIPWAMFIQVVLMPILNY